MWMARRRAHCARQRSDYPAAISMRLSRVACDAIDDWRAAQGEPVSTRTEAVRLAVHDWLTGMGLLKHREDPEGAN